MKSNYSHLTLISYFFLLFSLISSQETINFSGNNFHIESLQKKSSNLIYHIDLGTNSTLPEYCMIEQPKYQLIHFSEMRDIKDNLIYFNYQDYALGTDDHLFLLLKSCQLNMFKMNFTNKLILSEEKHIIFEKDIELQDALINRETYLGFHFSQKFKFIIIVIEKKIYFVDTNQNNLNYKLNELNFSGTISYSKIVNEKVFLLRNYVLLEIYEIQNDLTLKFLQLIDFSMILNLNKNTTQYKNFSDFEVNENILIFVEKQQNLMFIIRYNNNISAINKLNMRTETYKNTFIRLEFIKNKLFLLTRNDLLGDTYFQIQEFLIDDSNIIRMNPIKLNEDLRDLVVTEHYIFISYEQYSSVIPHSFIQPEYTNIESIRNFKISDLEIINQFEFKNYIFENYFTGLTDSKTLQIFKIDFTEGLLICDTRDINLKEENLKYFNAELIFYEMECKTLDSSCNNGRINIEKKLFDLKINKNKESETQKNEANQDYLINILFGIVLALGIIVFLGSCLFIIIYRRIKKRMSLLSKEFQTIRTLSKEELEIGTVNNNSQNSIRPNAV